MAATADDHPTLTAALGYAARGWRVIPIPPGKKRPTILAWQNEGTTDPDRIRHWWTHAPTHGIGILTGPESGIFVVDIDVANGKHGDESLHDLETTYGPLPATYEVITGSGGRHLYFRWPPGADIRNEQSGRHGDGIDVRGDGGQVLAPPTIHPNGRPYTHEASSPLEPADPPGWLVALLTRDNDPQRQPELRTVAPQADRPGDLWAAQTAWADLLGADGWTLHHTDPDGEQHWTRPGKDRREGTSATVNYKGTNRLKVFTSSAPGLDAEKTYSKLGYLAATQYDGDFSAAAEALAGLGWRAPDLDLHALAGTTNPAGTDETPSPNPAGTDLPAPVDWPDMWARPDTAEWLIEPIIPASRHVVLYAPAKMGKSLLALEIAAAAATGRKVLGQPSRPPVDVTYLDLEMTIDDLAERLEDMGYGPDDDLSRLHYYSLPSLPPLDTPLGGQIVAQLAQRDSARLIVIDTMARVVAGEEDKADTYRNFDMHTSLRLKAAGVAVLRLDHSGKDIAKGQRGSSEKVGYADLVWQLLYGEGGVGTLKATHRRIGWAPPSVTIKRWDEPHLRHTIDDSDTYPDGTKEVAELLDQLGMPLRATVRTAILALKDAGTGRRRQLVSAALKWRRHEAGDFAELVGKRRARDPNHDPEYSKTPVDNHGNRLAEPRSADVPPPDPGTNKGQMPPTSTGTASEPSGTIPAAPTGNHASPYKGTHVSGPREPESIFDLDPDPQEP